MIPTEVYTKTLMSFLTPIRLLLEAPDISEVMINGPDEIFVERKGKLERSGARFPSEQALVAALRCLAQYVGRPLDAEHPILEARTPDGSRVQAVLAPAAPSGPLVSIRRFSPDIATPEQLVARGSLTNEALELLRACVTRRKNLLVAGGAGSGKTSLLAAISSLIASDERVVVIEDAHELRLNGEHVVHLEAQPGDQRSRGAVSLRTLFRATLRLRPDRIVIGEVRGAEALDLVQAMTSGHAGCLSTIHASHPEDALGRLETLALMGCTELPLFALRAQIVSAVDAIVQTRRLSDGRRIISHISEVCDLCPQRGYRVRPLFVHELAGDEGPMTFAKPRVAQAPHGAACADSSGVHPPNSTDSSNARRLEP